MPGTRVLSILTAPQPLVQIPLHEVGIIDTYKAMIDRQIHPADREVLLKAGYREKQTKHGLGLSSKRCGIYLLCNPRWTTVNVCLPCLLGLSNHNQDVLTADATERAIAMALSLLPKTEAAARTSGTLGWYTRRLDLAVTIAVPCPPIAAAYQGSDHPSFRKLSGVYVGSAFVVFGTNYEMIIYDPEKKYVRSISAPSLRSRERSATRGTTRPELRLITTKALQGLSTYLLEKPEGGIPFLLKSRGAPSRVARFGIDLHTLHAFMATFISRFTDIVPGEPWVSGGYSDPIKNQGVLRLANDRVALAMVLEELSPQPRKRLMRLVQTARIQMRDLNLVKLGWPRPRPALSGDSSTVVAANGSADSRAAAPPRRVTRALRISKGLPAGPHAVTSRQRRKHAA